MCNEEIGVKAKKILNCFSGHFFAKGCSRAFFLFLFSQKKGGDLFFKTGNNIL